MNIGRKEDVAKLAQTLMRSQKNIRNLGIVAHIDHGKCVSGDTYVYLANGEIKQAQELFELGKSGKPIKTKYTAEVYDTTKSGIQALSFDQKSKKILAKKLSHVWKLKNEQALKKITFSNGFSIKTTPEHKFLCVNDRNEIIEKEAEKLEINDFILFPKKIPVNPLNLTEIKNELLHKLATNTGFMVRLNETCAVELKKKAFGYGLKKLVQEINAASTKTVLIDSIHKGRFRLKDYLALCKKLEIQNDYNGIETVNFRKSLKKAGKNSMTIRLPQTEYEFTEFMYLVGVIYGDGGKSKTEIRITNEDNEIIQAIIRVCQTVLRTNPVVRKYGNKARRIDLGAGLTFLEILKTAFELPTHKKAHSITMPCFVQKQPNALLKAFIQGYFDTDGTVEASRRAASISSASKQMLVQLSLCLLRFGCIATFSEKKQTLYLSGSNLVTFADAIGFRLSRKQEKLLNFAKISHNPNRNTDVLPISPMFIRDIRQKLEMPLTKLSKTFEAIEFRQQPVYLRNLNEFVSAAYSFVGNPKIKDKNAWETVQQLEQTYLDCATLKVTQISTDSVEKEVYDFTVPETHNFIGNGCIVHNTTTSDSLVAAAGLMSEELAGQQLVMDYYELEQERGITINAANISLAYKHETGEYLVNLIDTPGHVDFGGEVIRAMRAVDGVVVVVDAVEGVMPQTETVVRQALRENCKPILFLNKVDRLVNELKVSEKEMQERLVKVIARVNGLIKNNCPEQFKDQWTVRVEDGSVVFGSALSKWGISVVQMKKSGVTFGDVYQHCKNETQNELSKKSPLYRALMDAIIQHLPNPVQAQKYRTPNIWKGDMESDIGKSMETCNAEGKVAMMVTDVNVDPHAGEIATGRLYSGTLRKGSKVYLNAGKKEIIVQQVGIYMGPERVVLDEIPAGNIATITGSRDVYVGETVSSEPMQEFESFKTSVEPVITISIEAKHPKELPKLIEVVRQICKEDPNVRAEINQETGEHLISGMGELHLEVTRYRIEHDHKMEIVVSDPIVVYRETIKNESQTLIGKSPNKHNHIYMYVKPLSEEFIQKLQDAGLKGKMREKDDKAIDALKKMGHTTDEARRIWCIHNDCMLINDTRGIQALHEIKELVIQGFMDAMNEGPQAKEKCHGVAVHLEDARLHEDAIHRGPSQILPVMTRTIYACILSADAILLEPKQKLFINIPQDFMGAASKELQQRRTQIQEMNVEGDSSIIIALAPVKEMIGFSSAIRSATQGRAIWTAEFSGYEPLPRELQKNIVREVRKRKGLDEEVKPAEFFLE